LAQPARSNEASVDHKDEIMKRFLVTCARLSCPAAANDNVPSGGLSARGGSTETVHGCAGQLDAAGACAMESNGN